MRRPNEYLQITGNLSKNNFIDVSIRVNPGSEKYHLVDMFSLSAHMYGYPEHKEVTQSSSVCQSRTLDDNALEELENDLIAMASRVRDARENKVYDRDYKVTDTFSVIDPPVLDLQNCPDCGSEIQQDIFSRPKGQTNRTGGRFLEARACLPCKIIYEVLCD